MWKLSMCNYCSNGKLCVCERLLRAVHGSDSIVRSYLAKMAMQITEDCNYFSFNNLKKILTIARRIQLLTFCLSLSTFGTLMLSVFSSVATLAHADDCVLRFTDREYFSYNWSAYFRHVCIIIIWIKKTKTICRFKRIEIELVKPHLNISYLFIFCVCRICFFTFVISIIRIFSSCFAMTWFLWMLFTRHFRFVKKKLNKNVTWSN